jgi:hypothetical protein
MRSATWRPPSPPVAAVVLALALVGCHWASQAERDAGPIAEKNAAARGGLDAWRNVKTLAMSGQLEAGTPRDQAKLAKAIQRPTRERKLEARKALASGHRQEPEKPVNLPFVMELARPHKTRLEVRFGGQAAVQVFDGGSGWKLRPFLGRREVEPFTPDELQLATQQADLDGPLLDHAAKGSRIELEGMEPVEGRDAYRLKVTTSAGQVRHVWVDAQSYLDVKVDGTRKMDGKPRTVWTVLRDYRTVDGVKVPFLMETYVDGVAGSEKILVEKVTLNPKLDAARFTRPDPGQS